MHFQSRSLTTSFNLSCLYHYSAERYPFALISTNSDETKARFDIVFAFPQESLTLDCNNNLKTEINDIDQESGFLDAFSRWFDKEKKGMVDCDIPFTGGWFIFLSYELAGEIEPSLHITNPDINLPVAFAARCPAAVIYDRKKDLTILVAENNNVNLLDEMERDIASILSNNASASKKSSAEIESIRIKEADEKSYFRQVEKIKRYIYEGDIFQANLSRLWSIDIEEDIDDIDIFKLLSKRNSSSFAALIKIQDTVIISSSPERLVTVKNKIVETRPIAGTRPRSETQSKDTELADELMCHPKEIAEHVMLLDLERNDLGRICKPGSVKVDEFMVLESYNTVHHIVSNVTGILKDQKNPADIIRAVFPGGTITGCPKVRCMQILAELEMQPRGAYTGSVGYINLSGDMDLNILIRTMVRHKGKITLRAGGGIVHDSDPQLELQETRAKAKGLLNVFN